MALKPDIPLAAAPVPATHRAAARRNRKIQHDTAGHAGAAIGPISPGCEIFTLTNGQFSLIDVLQHVLDATGPADMTVATWTAADGDLRRAHAFMLDGRIRSLRFIVDPSFRSRKPEFCATLIDLFGNDAIRTTPLHAKFSLIRNEAWNIAVRSSMNLNPNRRIESVEISDDPALAEFLDGVSATIFSRSPAANFSSQNPQVNAIHSKSGGLAF